MPECQMRKDGEHTGWWPADDDAGYGSGKAGMRRDKNTKGCTIEQNQQRGVKVMGMMLEKENMNYWLKDETVLDFEKEYYF